MSDSKHYSSHGTHGIPWQDLLPRFMSDKTPPGWFVGCDLDLEKYEMLCEDWKAIQSYGKPSAWTEEDETAVVTALRMRLKGPAREVADENRKIRETPIAHGPQTPRQLERRAKWLAERPRGTSEDTAPPFSPRYLPDYATKWKTHFTILRTNFGKERQKISEKRYEEFLQYSRKRGHTVQEYVAESTACTTEPRSTASTWVTASGSLHRLRAARGIARYSANDPIIVKPGCCWLSQMVGR